MAFSSAHTLNILSDEEFANQIASIERTILEHCTSGTAPGFDGQPLHYEFFSVEHPVGTIIMVHGLSEFVEKFYELTWYFMNMGYNVFLYDQRGHGHSCRLTEDTELIHVESFDDYANDLHTLLHTVVIPLTGNDIPLFLLGHSLGGAVVTLYLSLYPATPIKKAVLSAPLMQPNLKKLPRPLAKSLTRMEIRRAGRADIPSVTSHRFNPNAVFENSPDMSKARFEYNLKRRCGSTLYQGVAKSCGWNLEALCLREKILNKAFIRRIQTPLLLLSSENDTLVKTKPHAIFAKRCRNCRLHIVQKAKHCLFTASARIMTEFITSSLEFYREDA